MGELPSSRHSENAPTDKNTTGMDSWDTGATFNPLSDPEERQVIFAALDSFR